MCFEMKNRIAYFDIAKGILIILLVFAHFRSAAVRMPYDSPYFSMVYNWNCIFTCFYMPAFFIISGYCSNFSKPLRVFLKSLFKTLLIPFVSFTIINQATVAIYNGTSFLDQMWQNILEGGGLWFLQAMIIAKMLFYALKRLRVSSSLNGGGYLIVFLMLMVVGVGLNQWKIGNNLFFLNHALIASFWIAIGQWLKEHPTIYEKMVDASVYVYPIVALASFFKCPSLTASISISLLTIPLHIIYSLVGTMFLLKLCKLVNENKVLEYWGKNSLVVYALHFTPLFFLFRYLWEWLQPATIWPFLFFFILLYGLVYGLCWLLMKLFNIKPFKYLTGRF